MTNRAALLLQQSLYTVLDLSKLLAKLLRPSAYQSNDLESQVMTYPTESSDELFALLSRSCSETSHRMQNLQNHGEDNYISSVVNYVVRDPHQNVPYAEGAARVFLHRDRKSKDSLALFINEEIVAAIQDAADEKRRLRKHEKLYNELSSQVLRAERAIEAAEEIYANAETEDEARKAREEIECQNLKLQTAMEAKDVMADRLRIFRINVGFTRDTACAFFEQALNDANLLDSTNANTSDMLSEAGVPPQSGRSSQRSDEDRSEDSCLDPDELFRKAAWEKLRYYTKDLEETQEQWDTWPDKDEDEREHYEDLRARGEDVGTQSEFDRFQLEQGMRITSYLIQVEKDQEQAREHAVALGVIDEDWGKPMYVNDQWEAESYTTDEMIDHMKTKNWGRVERWVESVSKAVDKSSTQHDQAPEPTDLDDWDAETINMGEDCVSAVAHDPIERNNTSRWQMMKGHK